MQVTQITSQTTVVFKGNVPNHVLENPQVEVNKVSTIGLYVATFYYDSELDRLGFPIEVLDPSNNLLAQLRRTKSLSETIEGDVNAGQMDAEWLLNAVRCQRQFKFDPFGYEFGNLNLTPHLLNITHAW